MIYIGIIAKDDSIREQLKREAEYYYSMKKEQPNFLCFKSKEDYQAANPHLDIVFIDSAMPNRNEVAYQIKGKNPKSDIFICICKGSEHDSPEILSHKTIQIPLTSDVTEHLKKTEALRHILQANPKIELNFSQGVSVISLRDVLYVEVKQHYLFYHLDASSDYPTKILSVKGTMQSLSKELQPFDFCKCSAAYLANLIHVVSVKKKMVFLRNGETLPLSRTCKSHFLTEWNQLPEMGRSQF